MKNILLDIKKNVFTPTAILSVLLALLMFSEKLVNIEIGYYSYGDLISYCYLFTPFIVFAPIISSATGSSTVCDDIKNGYIKYMLIRMSKENYTINKFISGIFSGGIVMAFSSSVLAIIILILGVPIGKDYNSTLNGPFDGTAFESIQYLSGGLIVIIVTIVLSFIFGAIWSGVGIAFSVYTSNKYLAIVFPLILYYSMNMLFLKFDVLLKFSPWYTIIPGTTSIKNLSFIFTEQLFFLLIIFFAYYLGAEVKLKNV